MVKVTDPSFTVPAPLVTVAAREILCELGLKVAVALLAVVVVGAAVTVAVLVFVTPL